jgi:hypothetical protein
MTIRRAAHDPDLTARVVSCRKLLYTDGADADLDRPAHVRAGSGLARWGSLLAVVQDDASFVGLVDPASGTVHGVPLPPGPDGGRHFHDGRGNKHLKPDFEAVVAVPPAAGGMLLAFGSGSTPLREQVAVLRGSGNRPEASLVHLPALYARLRAAGSFSGSEMNVEGAAWVNGRVRLFNRGNGAARGGWGPVDATCELGWPALRAHLRDPAAAPPPEPQAVVRYLLGELDGVRLGFTAATGVGNGSVVFAGAAEDSPDAVADGPVAGSVLGVMAPDGGARWCVLTDAGGRPFREKVEGVVPGDRPGSLYVVADPDDDRTPCDLCTMELGGAWW